MGKKINNVKFEVKTACGSLEFHKGTELVAYCPAPCMVDVASNAYLYSLNGFMSMLNGYESPRGGKGIIRTKDSRTTIQSFHWIDQAGNEYRPKASKAIEAYLVDSFSYSPTVADLFDLLGLEHDGFDEMVKAAYETVVSRSGGSYSGAFGDAFEIAFRRTISPATKYRTVHMPASSADVCGRLGFTVDELCAELGIE